MTVQVKKRKAILDEQLFMAKREKMLLRQELGDSAHRYNTSLAIEKHNLKLVHRETDIVTFAKE